jgi:hypothetical protein
MDGLNWHRFVAAVCRLDDDLLILNPHFTPQRLFAASFDYYFLIIANSGLHRTAPSPRA